MTRRRFYAPPEQFAPDGATVALAREEASHLRNVLRLKAGDEVFVFDGEGREYVCVVAASESGGRARVERATLEVRGQVEPERAESPLDLTLAVALLKGEKFDLVVQKATELGVWRIVPVVTKRSDVRVPREGRNAAAATADRVPRWRRIALEAAKQSGRARLPEIFTPVSFASLVEEDAGALFKEGAGVAAATAADGQRLLFTERGGRGLAETAKEWREEEKMRPAKLTALVGPEGGWDDEEIAEAVAAGWLAVTFGGRVLRAETAAIVITGLLQHLCGDLV
ncbi:MAG TPA: 16S rRNA (uracil(1498)-N(3))-methyltransferase [Pyrinomonadaceae bacterium]|nr:16S rRNA (uracil(1498)-N(3))-methyltransferase [Pyrinomonadaceae bacterium]